MQGKPRSQSDSLCWSYLHVKHQKGQPKSSKKQEHPRLYSILSRQIGEEEPVREKQTVKKEADPGKPDSSRTGRHRP